MTILPNFHGFGLCVSMHAPLCLRMEVILIPEFEAKRFHKTIQKYRPNALVGVPTLWEAMLSNKRFDDVDLSDLKYMVSGGDTMTNGMEDKINNFISRFVSTFNKYNLSPDLVEVEIVEESVASDKIILQKVIDALHNNGFSIAMDDFGKGESSLNMLSSVPIDVVKFDQNFLRNNSSLEESSDFITSLVDLGKKLNKKTVFEGVETKEQRDFLRSINCDVVQGYFYSKPLSENDFIQFVKDHI